MKLFVVLLLVGIVSCYFDLTSGMNDVSCLKDEYGISALDSPYPTSSRRSIFPGIGGFDIADQTSSFYGGDAYAGGMSAASHLSPPSPFPSRNLVYTSAPAICARHQLVRHVRPVIEERYRNVPTVKTYVRNNCVHVTQKRPVVAKDVATAETTVVRHVPVLKKNQKIVIDQATSSVPVIRKRVVPVVEKYVQQVPVMTRYYRPVVDEDRIDVSVLEKRIHPVTESVNHVPITERRFRPAPEPPLTIERASYPYRLYSPTGSPYIVCPYGSPVAPPVAPSVVPPVAPPVTPISADQLPVVPDCSPLAKGQNFYAGCPCAC